MSTSDESARPRRRRRGPLVLVLLVGGVAVLRELGFRRSEARFREIYGGS